MLDNVNTATVDADLLFPVPPTDSSHWERLPEFPPYETQTWSFDPRWLKTRAEIIQFKLGGDHTGVTGKHDGMNKKWISACSGNIVAWLTSDPALVVGDGHQRRNESLEAVKNGYLKRLNGFLLRETEGWTAELVFEFCVLKNLCEGGHTTTATDLAHAIRQGARVDIIQKYAPNSNEAKQDGVWLSKLSDPAFALVRSGRAHTKWGVMVAQLVQTHGELGAHLNRYKITQEAVLEALIPLNPATLGETRFHIQQIMNGAFVKLHTQIPLNLEFKEGKDRTVSAYKERLKIFKEAVSILVKRRVSANHSLNDPMTLGIDLSEQRPAIAETTDRQMLAYLLLRTKANVRDSSVCEMLNAAAVRSLSTKKQTKGEAQKLADDLQNLATELFKNPQGLQELGVDPAKMPNSLHLATELADKRREDEKRRLHMEPGLF